MEVYTKVEDLTWGPHPLAKRVEISLQALSRIVDFDAPSIRNTFIGHHEFYLKPDR